MKVKLLKRLRNNIKITYCETSTSTYYKLIYRLPNFSFPNNVIGVRFFADIEDVIGFYHRQIRLCPKYQKAKILKLHKRIKITHILP